MIDNRKVTRSKIFLLDENFKIPYDNSVSLSELFHENTKMRKSDVRPWLVHIIPEKMKSMALSNFFTRAQRSYKVYHGSERINFPIPEDAVPGTLWEVLRCRRTRRNFVQTPMRPDDLANILFYSYGETGLASAAENPQRLRAAPSAGALYPLDIYVLSENITDISQGLYHYNVKSHCLELLNSGSYLADVYQYIQPENNEWILTAACILFVTATFGRNQIKYGERGYRGVLFDAGHLAQNLQLSAEYLRHGACLSMACLDDEMNDFLRIDGIEESILYSVIIGTLE